MAKKRESTVSTAADVQYIRGITSNGQSVRISKSDLINISSDIIAKVIKIGGRNLLIGSNIEKTIASGTSPFFNLKLSMPLIKGETYIISANVQGGYEDPILSNGSGADNDRQTIKFNVPFTALYDTHTHIRCYHLSTHPQGKIGFPKLEKGNVPTDWMPAPEEMINI